MRQNLYDYSADRVLSSNSDGIIMSELKRIIGMAYIFKADIVFFNFGSALFYSDTINLDGRFFNVERAGFKKYNIYIQN